MNNKNIIDFIYEEAFLLDTMQWERWLELYASDARYWMPMEWDQQDPIMQQSLMYEDIFLLKVRVERLSGERTFSQKPKSRCHHLLQAPKIIDIDEDGAVSLMDEAGNQKEDLNLPTFPDGMDDEIRAAWDEGENTVNVTVQAAIGIEAIIAYKKV